MMEGRKPNDNEIEMMERAVHQWFEDSGFPISVFRELESHEQVLLYNLVGTRTSRPSDLELRKLTKKLRTLAARQKGLSADPVESLTYEELMELYLPQDYLRKF